MVSRDALRKALQMEPAQIDPLLEALIGRGDITETPRGLMLTSAGRASLAADIAAEREGLDAEKVNAVYERFSVLNARFKPLMADWQLRQVDGVEVLNDHTDADYDAQLIDRLKALDPELQAVLADIVALAPRLAIYAPRFALALAGLVAGDRAMMAAPIKDSYHTLWFELHEEFIDLCGRTRIQEAVAGRGD